MDWNEFLFSLAYDNSVWLIAIVALVAIGGNPVILILGTLSARGIFPFWGVLFLAILGSIIAETFWFYLGKMSRRKKFNLYSFKRKIDEVSKNIGEKAEKHLLAVFALMRVAYGTKIISFFTAGRQGMRAKTFFKYNIPLSIAWVSLIYVLGWATGKGIARFDIVLKEGQIFVTVSILIAIIFVVILRFFQKRIKV